MPIDAMNFNFSGVDYRTEMLEDSKMGCAGLHLYTTAKGETSLIATITFWDASGQFFLKLNANEIVLDVIERFISEAKQQIPIS